LYVVLSFLSRIAAAVGATLIVPTLLAVALGEWRMASCFATVSAATLLGSFPGLRLSVPSEVRPSQAMVVSSLGWLLAAFIGSLPYHLSGYMSLLDAYFESMAGFTTTGMTLFSNLESLPRSLLFWRAFTQWLGGAGVILFLLLFVVPGGVGVWRLYLAEAREERLTVRAWDTVKNIWAIYAGYTAACAALLVAVGIDPFEAVCHSFTVLSTGGFSTRTASIEAFNNPAAEVVLVAFMIIGGTNFLVHSLLVRREFRRALSNTELRAMLVILAASSALISVDLLRTYDPLTSVRLAVFQAASIMTTTGYTTIDINLLPSLSQAVLLVLMVVGGSLCSTAGAVKVARITVLAKASYREVLKAILPSSAVKPLKIGGKVLELDDALRVAGFFFAYMLMASIATLIVAAEGHSLAAALSAVLSAQGNVGPAYISLFSLGPTAKATLIALMWAGRLELMPVLVLFTTRAWRELA